MIWIRGRWEKLLTMKTKYNRKHKLIPVILHENEFHLLTIENIKERCGCHVGGN